MSAKEMFKKLGYKQTLQYDEDLKDDLIAIRYKNRHNIEIIFDLLDCDFVKFGKIWEHLGNSSINMEELKAINKQVEELRWYNERKILNRTSKPSKWFNARI